MSKPAAAKMPMLKQQANVFTYRETAEGKTGTLFFTQFIFQGYFQQERKYPVNL